VAPSRRLYGQTAASARPPKISHGCDDSTARAGDTANGSIAVNPTRRGHMASMATRLVTMMVLAGALGLGACASSDTMTSGDKMSGDKMMGDKTKGDTMMEKK
jgi:hypothetical protein